MINIIDKQNCCGCHACNNICPQKCIMMQSDNEGFWYPLVEMDKCSDCGLCDGVCPVTIRDVSMHSPVAYACINKNAKIREQSSSGGIFTVIAERVLFDKGVVFGAGFDDEFNVVHSWTDSLDGLGKYRGSKYVQSRIGDTYKQVDEFLKQGRTVLFSGTPCQIAALKSYLDKDYSDLICLDIICHGVPSPLVWQRYKLQMEEIHQAKASRIDFRRKNGSWKLFSVSLTFDNGTEYIRPMNGDLFMQGFLQDLYLRPSCYACNFKSLNRQGDITLADFWGIEQVLPSLDDDKGTSLVLVNSSKGAKIFSAIEDNMRCEKVDVDKSLSFNSAALNSVVCCPKRDHFFEELENTSDIIQLIAKYTSVSFSKRARVKSKTILGIIKRKLFG